MVKCHKEYNIIQAQYSRNQINHPSFPSFAKEGIEGIGVKLRKKEIAISTNDSNKLRLI